MSNNNAVSLKHEQEEYRQVKKDLTFVLVLNGILLAALVGLYFVNRSSGQVDQFFSRILKF